MLELRVVGAVMLTALSGAFIGLMVWNAAQDNPFQAMANGIAFATFGLGAFKLSQMQERAR